MLFNSIEFLIFCPLVFLLYWFVFKSLRWQNLFIVVASYVFYGWWNYRFLFLIALTTFCSFVSGLLVEKYSQRKIKKLITSSNIILNLAILCVYKYYNFFVESFEDMMRLVGLNISPQLLHIVLPVGISFYTFQALSYTIDVYKNKIKPTHDIVAFFAFISFFPQLVAGPIERATNLLPQFLKPKRFDYSQAVDGMRQILWGFFKKIVVADNCAVLVNTIFDNYQNNDGMTLLLGGIFFTFQIYGDFSGYSDIAIGTARLFGINLMRNFAFPYFSRNIAEFWRRWHISLNTWFRDYIYFPLGGSRCSKFKVIRNTMVIFLVSGFWHGANYTFVTWGAYHALLFVPLFLLGQNRKFTNIVAEDKCLPSFVEMSQMLLTFVCVLVGWILFRSATIADFVGYMEHMISSFAVVKPSCRLNTLVFIVLLMVVEWMNRHKQHGLQIDGTGRMMRYRVVRWITYATILLIIVSFSGSQSDFIYFQF